MWWLDVNARNDISASYMHQTVVDQRSLQSATTLLLHVSAKWPGGGPARRGARTPERQGTPQTDGGLL